jgi:hypothetical protein
MSIEEAASGAAKESRKEPLLKSISLKQGIHHARNGFPRTEAASPHRKIRQPPSPTAYQLISSIVKKINELFDFLSLVC